MPVYLDNAATTKPCAEAVEAAVRAMTENYGNPSSLHRMGLDAQLCADKARKQVMLIYGFGELISQVMEINRRLDKVKETEEVPAKEVNAKAPAQVTKNETKNDTVPGNSASSDPFGSWSCPKCGTKNLNSRKSCWRCEYEL